MLAAIYAQLVDTRRHILRAGLRISNVQLYVASGSCTDGMGGSIRRIAGDCHHSCPVGAIAADLDIEVAGVPGRILSPGTRMLNGKSGDARTALQVHTQPVFPACAARAPFAVVRNAAIHRFIGRF